MNISPCTVADIERAPNLAALLAEYGAESAIAGLGEAEAQLDLYRAMEASGALHTAAAYQGDTLIGFLLFVVSTLPHYGKRIATTESFFVASARRQSGAGLALLREAEALAAPLGAEGLFVTAPAGSKLEYVMSRQPYRQTNSVFFRRLT